jgi:hypothetical protein
VQADRTRYCGTGQTVLLPRKQPVTVLKYPKDGVAYQAVIMTLPTTLLRVAGLLHAAHPGARAARFTRPAGFPKKPLLQSLFASLVPYLELAYCLPEKLLQWSH